MSIASDERESVFIGISITFEEQVEVEDYE